MNGIFDFVKIWGKGSEGVTELERSLGGTANLMFLCF